MKATTCENVNRLTEDNKQKERKVTTFFIRARRRPAFPPAFYVSSKPLINLYFIDYPYYTEYTHLWYFTTISYTLISKQQP